MRRLLWFLVSIVVAVSFLGSAASASIIVRVHVASQTMHVAIDGVHVHTWPVSTAGRGAVTPRGTFRPQWLSPHHRSRKYRWAPMPNAVFYSGNYAIHGTRDEHLIGSPASRGCVRLTVANSRTLFELVRSRMQETTIIIEG